MQLKRGELGHERLLKSKKGFLFVLAPFGSRCPLLLASDRSVRSKARSPVCSFLLLLVRHLLLEAMHLFLVASLLLVMICETTV